MARQLIVAGVAEQIYDIIRERITTFRFKPGEKIDIRSLADEFGTSPMPIRDALKRCADEGLINVVPRVGHYVVDLTEQDVREIFDLRKLFEIHALELGIHHIERDKLLRLKEDLEAVSLETDQTAYRTRFDETDVRLHSLIIEGAVNLRLQAFARQIHDHVSIVRHMTDLMERGLEDHLDIVDVLLKGDLPRAKRLLAVHLDRAGEAAISTLQGRTSTSHEFALATDRMRMSRGGSARRNALNTKSRLD